jgi:hypothetical protein
VCNCLLGICPVTTAKLESRIQLLNELYMHDYCIKLSRNPDMPSTKPWGVFTARPYRKFEVICQVLGTIIDHKTYLTRYTHVPSTYVFVLKKYHLYIDLQDPWKSNVARFINGVSIGQCPNCILYKRGNHLYVCAATVLLPDIELCFQYGNEYYFE